jgi:hypothetical protein
MIIKLLLAGAWKYAIYQSACAEALERLGVEVERFAWNSYFAGPLGRAQEKWVVPGPAMRRLNRDLLRSVVDYQPDVVFIWNGTHIQLETLRAIRRYTGALLVSYNNDDPFGPQKHGRVPRHHHRFWKYYLRNIPEYDVHFVYRHINVGEIKSAGARAAYLLRSYYVPALHHPVTLNEQERSKYGGEVAFVGHYENDGRVDYLRALVEAGVKVKLFGPRRYWTRKVLGPMADYFGQVHEVTGLEYAKALCGADMPLCFLSRLNRDTYTRRCFEIPACGRLLLSERTADLQTLYEEGEEAVYFSTPAELVEQVLMLRRKPDRIRAIAEAGHQRLMRDDHSVDGRMKSVVTLLTEHLNKR